jgi:hypothetical protein
VYVPLAMMITSPEMALFSAVKMCRHAVASVRQSLSSDPNTVTKYGVPASTLTAQPNIVSTTAIAIAHDP